MQLHKKVTSRQRKLVLAGATAIVVNTILLGCTGESTPSQLSRNSSDYPTTTSNEVVGHHSSNNINTNRKIALIIGNASYTGVPELKNPTNDAQDLAKTLRNLGFEVMEEENVKNSKDMRDIVLNFSNKLRKGGVGLFYYSGHGIQVDGENYLIPTSASLRSEADVGYEALGMGYVQKTLDEANNGMNIIILDACRDNPFARSIRRSTRGKPTSGLAQMDSAKGSLIAFSTAPGSTAEDGSGRNGTYTKHLLANINKPGVSVEALFKRVRVGVAEETEGQQTPWESTSLTGDFCFAGCQDPTVVAAAAQATAEAERLRKEIEQQKLEAERLKAEAELLKKQQLESQQFKVETLKKQQELEAQRLAAEVARQKAIVAAQAQPKAVAEEPSPSVKEDANKKLQEAIAKAWQEQQQKQVTQKKALEAQELREQQAAALRVQQQREQALQQAQKQQQQQVNQKEQLKQQQLAEKKREQQQEKLRAEYKEWELQQQRLQAEREKAQQQVQPSQPSQAVVVPTESGENDNRNVGSF